PRRAAMCRWLVLTVFSVAPLLAGCGPTLTAGLANGPRLGGSAVADSRVTDAVANGSDACRPVGEGSALRGKLPACPTIERPPLVPLTIVVHDPGADALVIRWLRHFYVDWPCQGARPEGSVALAFAAPASTSGCGP
ncbi:MAG: hypothetical protein ACRELB_12960, partial [Polyangiaceae bacterium]